MDQIALLGKKRSTHGPNVDRKQEMRNEYSNGDKLYADCGVPIRVIYAR